MIFPWFSVNKGDFPATVRGFDGQVFLTDLANELPRHLEECALALEECVFVFAMYIYIYIHPYT